MSGDQVDLIVDYVGPEGPAMEELKRRAREALAAAGFRSVKHDVQPPPRQGLRVIRGGGGQQ